MASFLFQLIQRMVFSNCHLGYMKQCIWSQCEATWSVTHSLLFLRNVCLIPWKFTVSKSHNSPDCFSSVLKRLDKLPPSYKGIFFIQNSFESKTLNQNCIFSKLLQYCRKHNFLLRRPSNSKHILMYLLI